MPAKRLEEFLDHERIKYVRIRHSPAYTAQEVAQSAHVSGREMAKTVMLVVDGHMTMAVLPANRRVLLHDLEEALGADEVRFATEKEFLSLFPDCEIGAMPPFGNLYGVPVLVAPGLEEDTEIAFNAGTHTEVVRMAYADYARLVHPRQVAFTD